MSKVNNNSLVHNVCYMLFLSHQASNWSLFRFRTTAPRQYHAQSHEFRQPYLRPLYLLSSQHLGHNPNHEGPAEPAIARSLRSRLRSALREPLVDPTAGVEPVAVLT